VTNSTRVNKARLASPDKAAEKIPLGIGDKSFRPVLAER
jgi:hypothetical protein